MKTLDLLVGKYKLCVEYYDQLLDPIKFYFLEKIQQVLSEENTI